MTRASTILFALLALVVAPVAQASELDSRVRSEIAALFDAGQRFALPIERVRADLERYYLDETGPLLWLRTPRKEQLIDRMREAAGDGLDPADYPADFLIGIAPLETTGTPRELAEIELWYSAHFLKFASDIKVGRVVPRRVDSEVFVQDKAILPFEALTVLADSPSLDAFVSTWEPQRSDYAVLKVVLSTLRAIEAEGGWPKVSPGEALKPGDQDPRVVELRARLAADGHVAPPTDAPDVFDDDLADALIAFQRRHGLEPDGVMGKRTLLQLNIASDQRVRQVVATLERLRWMPEDLGTDHIFVNIPAFEMRHVDDGEVVDVMDVIVGREYRRTPVFSETMKYVEINPWWNVPVSIARRDKLPVLRKNPQGLAAQGFVAYQGETEIPVTAINWAAVSPSQFPVRLRQRPGPANALGQVKFMLPNRHNIYLHDTPSRELFSRAKRDFSSGCIRLHRPIDLAEQVLGRVGWDQSRIEAALATGERTVVNLAEPLPVHITYSTAWVSEEGIVHFASDLYRRDEKLLAALDGRPVPW